MAPSPHKTSIVQWLHLFFGVVLVLSFFLPWVTWAGVSVNGAAMATGDFFKNSVGVSGPENPFPKLSFSFYLFWLIPILAAISVILVLQKKKVVPFVFITGALSLALITVYYLFSKTLATDFSVGNGVSGMLNPAIYIHAIAAIGLIVTAFPVKSIIPKIIWLVIGPVFAYTGYTMGEKYIMSETHTATEKVQADYTVDASQLIKEFISNDTATNKKYREKMLIVNGNTSAVEIQSDSTSTIKFADSSGSYAIFSFDKTEFDKVKTIKDGDPVSLKGVCSGSIFSEILGTTAITFKRATLKTGK
jgi:tRNA_anti-like